MTEPQFFATPGYGEIMRRDRHYSQAVRIGDRVEISGQGGWNDSFEFPAELAAEIVRAFDNVERTLAEAGAAWTDVVSVDSLHVLGPEDFEEHNRIMIEQFRKRLGDRHPIWTEIGVAALGDPAMRVEIRVVAVTG
ncbi:enamine deaminase RidA (YjgF/YER057c/UK114 family) [Catenuloplanes nepalensis]|uniref:Enamine deaminase RidA (YjgF/YER057c/UK114 family) n=1 Tax=Catenuloplanes nepalensis TaxID=587533 RepID=A0ABT9MUF6_9ACTN|nr:Rid family hydrolase [Catenuloplanes nepalensis]MDP9795072.1 enamine deaminase RidA (YjgF/YER057c/UK114 family) [Catenuloplanes nepalensis]